MFCLLGPQEILKRKGRWRTEPGPRATLSRGSLFSGEAGAFSEDHLGKAVCQMLFLEKHRPWNGFLLMC